MLYVYGFTKKTKKEGLRKAFKDYARESKNLFNIIQEETDLTSWQKYNVAEAYARVLATAEMARLPFPAKIR